MLLVSGAPTCPISWVDSGDILPVAVTVGVPQHLLAILVDLTTAGQIDRVSKCMFPQTPGEELTACCLEAQSSLRYRDLDSMKTWDWKVGSDWVPY